MINRNVFLVLGRSELPVQARKKLRKWQILKATQKHGLVCFVLRFLNTFWLPLNAVSRVGSARSTGVGPSNSDVSIYTDGPSLGLTLARNDYGAYFAGEGGRCDGCGGVAQRDLA